MDLCLLWFTSGHNTCRLCFELGEASWLVSGSPAVVVVQLSFDISDSASETPPTEPRIVCSISFQATDSRQKPRFDSNCYVHCYSDHGTICGPDPMGQYF